jgi:hypothetical protein
MRASAVDETLVSVGVARAVLGVVDGGHMKARHGLFVGAGALAATLVAIAATGARQPDVATSAGERTPAFVKRIPRGYRDWRLISVAQEEGDLQDIRAILGNDQAIAAYRDGRLPFPDGTIIARLAWAHRPSAENNATFGREQSFVAGEPRNGVQFMVKDAKRYAATGGWGYGHFDDGKPASDAMLEACHGCHQAVAGRDFVFTRYSP